MATELDIIGQTEPLYASYIKEYAGRIAGMKVFAQQTGGTYNTPSTYDFPDYLWNSGDIYDGM